MRFLIPIISAILFRLGGSDQVKWIPFNMKLFRWLMGIAIGLLLWKGLILYSCTVAAYFLATNLFAYGDNTPILKYLPKPWKFAVSGFMFGLSSVFLIGWLAIAQAVVSALAFVVIMELDDTDIIKNPWVELLRGFLGTIVMVR